MKLPLHNTNLQPIRGRGTAANPPNRFERLSYETPTPEDVEGLTAEQIEETPAPQTQFFKDHARSILTRNNSPDIGFEYSINAYRGCEHGCIYCYARPTHEYLGFASGLDFETKIMVKEDAPQLLRKELSARSWKPQVISMSGVTDCYQPIERKLNLTRKVLEVLLDFRNPVGIITKNFLVTRDIDLLSEMAQYDCAAVFISVTTLDPQLARIMEPRTAQPARRLEAIRRLSEAGIPTGVLVCPVIPGLTDHEMPAILQACSEAGAQFAGYNMLHLPYAVKDLFDNWLSTHLPEKRSKVLSKIRDVRGGKLNDSNFGTRMTGEGPFADQVKGLFKIACKKAGITNRGPQLSTAHFRRPTVGQLQLFE
jgi:DNA repair photolyase